jgi:hypothetical protein
MLQATDAQRYARCIEVSKRVRFDIEHDVIRSHTPGTTKRFLPDGLSNVDELENIVSGVKDERFQAILGSMVTDAQMKRIGAALQPILS